MTEHARLTHSGWAPAHGPYLVMARNPKTPAKWKLANYGHDTVAIDDDKLTEWFDRSQIQHIPDQPGKDIMGNFKIRFSRLLKRLIFGGDCEEACIQRIRLAWLDAERGMSYLVCWTPKREYHMVILVRTTRGDAIMDNRYGNWLWLKNWMAFGNRPDKISAPWIWRRVKLEEPPHGT